MATPAREISEGYPVDGQVFELPQQSRDDEKPRFVTILGSFIEPLTAQERQWTRFGGIEASNPCLRYVRDFICKGRITPVLKDTYPWMGVDIWEKATAKDASYFPRPIPQGYVAPTDAFGNPSKMAPMVGKPAYPGTQINSIVNGSANILDRSRRGIVELKSLYGMDFNIRTFEVDGVMLTTDPELWRIQRAIFPLFPKLPTLVDETGQLLDAAQVHTSLRPTIDEMSTSLNQFRDFAQATVEQTHYTMRESAAKSNAGYIPRYTDLDFVLLEQLGMARQDREIRQAVKSGGNEKLEGMFEQWLAIQIEEKRANIEREKRLAAVAETGVDANTMAAVPIAKEEKEQLSCECGKYSGTRNGLRMHKTMHCELREAKEPTTT